MIGAPLREILLPAPARAALAPFPGRWREALVVAGATITALAIALVLQVPSFAAPNVAYIALQHTTVCTWHNLVRRLLIGVGAGVILIPVGGFLVQTPWLLVPGFFLLIATLTYGVPAARNPIESILIAFPLVGVCFSGTYDAGAIAVSTRDLVAASAIGVVVATLFARLSSRTSARVRLAESLAASFARSRERLTSTLRAYESDDLHAPGGEAPVFTELASHVQLLDLARQEGVGAVTERTLVTLSTAAERILSYVGTIDTLSRQQVGRSYRRALAAEIDRLASDLAHALEAFERTALRLGTHDDVDVLAAQLVWPDVASRVDELRTRQLEVMRSGATAAVDVAESGNLNALVQALASLADVLHTPPWELRELAAAERLATPPVWPFSMLPLDRLALRYALQVALGATIALVLGIAAHEPELSTLLWNPILVAQMSYGATIRKASLRLGGVVAGGAAALLTIVLVFANTDDLGVWLGVLFAVVALCQYAVLGMPLNWYGPFQVAVTYFVVLVAAEPTTDVGTALWRAFGTFAGTAILFAVFRLVGPDYAGRQLVARFIDLLRLSARYLPPPEATLPPEAELIAMRVAAARASGDVLRLIEEARLEGAASGLDIPVAVEAAGLALRVSLRAGIVARGRSTVAWPPLGNDLRVPLERVRAALRERIVLDLALLDARHTMATPGTRTHRAACDAARAHAGRSRPDVAAALADLVAAVAVARAGAMRAWPLEVGSALMAEVEHLRRMCELVPKLDEALATMVLPVHGGDEALVAAAAAPLAGAVSRP